MKNRLRKNTQAIISNPHTISRLNATKIVLRLSGKLQLAVAEGGRDGLVAGEGAVQ
jgi:hypothetical protein